MAKTKSEGPTCPVPDCANPPNPEYGVCDTHQEGLPEVFKVRLANKGPEDFMVAQIVGFWTRQRG